MPKGAYTLFMSKSATKFTSRPICLIILISLLITLTTGCNTGKSLPDSVSETTSSAPVEINENSFDKLCNELFLYMVQADSITLNYNLSQPEKYGITNMAPTLGEYSATKMYDEYAYYENKLASLKKLDKETLSEQDKLTYDILIQTIEYYEDTGSYVMYCEPLSPTTGIQTQLPVLLSEYHFYNLKSVDDYLGILNCVPGYFNNILEYEQQKKDDGLFMGAEAADEIIKQCKEFIKDPEGNFLIDIFDDNIENVQGITDEQISSYSTQNSKLIKETVIPSYNSLIEGLEKLKDPSSECVGLCELPDGADYYTSLIHSQTGSIKSPKEIKSLLENSLEDSRKTIANIIANDSAAYDEINNPKYAETKPKKILEYLSKNISPDFPSVPGNGTNKYTIKYVHRSLEDALSPAMFITPPIDCEVNDSIYINKAECNDSSIFTTLAHEGFPGHMYQSEYFMSTNPDPLRIMLNFGGYSEGWATYAEICSYSVSGISSNAAKILENNKIALLCIYSLIDMGIHYYKWDRSDCAKILSDNGITDNNAINEVYFSVITEPALYLKYTLGYLEFASMRRTAEDSLGDSFDAAAFHDFLLKTGPAWFNIISDRLDKWIETQKTNK